MIKILLSILFAFIVGTFLSYLLTTKIICANKPNDTACGFVLYMLTPVFIVFIFLASWVLLKLFKIKLFQNGKQMIFSLITLVILIAFYTFYEHASPDLYWTLYNKVGLFKSDSTPQISQEISKEPGIRGKALEYLSTKPKVSGQDWDSFFKNSHLAQVSRGRRIYLDYEWFKSHESTVLKKDKSYIITWKGLPGCEEDKSKPGGPEYGPNYFDSKGNQCGLLWLVEVYLDENLNPVSVKISEVGGVI